MKHVIASRSSAASSYSDLKEASRGPSTHESRRFRSCGLDLGFRHDAVLPLVPQPVAAATDLHDGCVEPAGTRYHPRREPLQSTQTTSHHHLSGRSTPRLFRSAPGVLVSISEKTADALMAKLEPNVRAPKTGPRCKSQVRDAPVCYRTESRQSEGLYQRWREGRCQPSLSLSMATASGYRAIRAVISLTERK